MTETKSIQAGERTHSLTWQANRDKARTQHTPGPWMIEEGLTVIGPPNRHYLKGAGNRAVAVINGASEANANLIASAPELLEALRNLLTINAISAVVNIGASLVAPSAAYTKVLAARKAIAKAEGK